jgi:hypothetical protein
LSARSRFSISSLRLDPESDPFLPQHMIPGAMPVATGAEGGDGELGQLERRPRFRGRF